MISKGVMPLLERGLVLSQSLPNDFERFVVFRLLFLFVLQFVNSFINSSSGGGVAYAAHIGGFISGVILILYFNRTHRKKSFKTKNKNIKKGPWER